MGGGRRGAATSLAYGHPTLTASGPPLTLPEGTAASRSAAVRQSVSSLAQGAVSAPARGAWLQVARKVKCRGLWGRERKGRRKAWSGVESGERKEIGTPGLGGGRGREERWGEGGGGGAAAGLRARELQTGWLRPQPELPPALRSRRSASAREDVPAEAAADGGATRGGLPSTLGRLRLRAPGDP